MNLSNVGLALATTVAIVVIWFLPGFLILSLPRRLQKEEAIASSFGVSALIYGCSSFVAHLLGVSQRAFSLLTIVVVVGGLSAYFAFSRRNIGNLRSPVLALLGLFSLNIFAFQAISPIYEGGNWCCDWWEHYSISQVYLHQGDLSTTWFGLYTLASRTPLFNLNGSFALSLFGDNFWAFQLISSLLNSCVIASTYILFKRVFGIKVAMLSALLFFFNTWIIHGVMFTWSKMFTTYAILLSLYYYLKFRQARSESPPKIDLHLCLCAVFGAVAYMSHQSALYYVVAIVIDYVILSRIRPTARLGFANAALSIAIFALITLPWYIWLFKIHGLRESIGAVPTFAGGPTTSMRVHGIIENAITSIIPLPFLNYVLDGGFQLREAYYQVIELYFNPLLGALTISLTLMVLSVSLRRIFVGKISPQFWRTLYFLKADWGCIALGVLMLLTVYLSRPAYEFDHISPEPFFVATGLALLIAGMVMRLRKGRGPQEISSTDLERNSVFVDGMHPTMVIFMVSGYLGGLLVHPYGDHDGIATAAMTPSVILLFGYVVSLIHGLDLRWRIVAFAGVVIECTLTTWPQLLSIIYGVAFIDNGNWPFKSTNALVFLYDLIEPYWPLFAVLAFFCQLTVINLFRLYLRGCTAQSASNS